MLNEDPLGITRSSPEPSPIVSVLLATAACKVMLVLFDITNLPMVSVGTPVIVRVVPVLNWRTSFVAGEVRSGDQFVLVTQEALSAPCQVYVVCPHAVALTIAIKRRQVRMVETLGRYFKARRYFCMVPPFEIYGM